MTFRARVRRWFCFSVVLVITISLWTAGPLAAQPLDMADEPVIPIDPADLATPAGQQLQQGITYLRQGNPVAASHLLYLVFNDWDATDALRSRATYELGRCMYMLGLYYSSLYFFETVVMEGSDQPFYIPSLSWLLLIVRQLPGEPDMLFRISQYEEFFPDQIEEKYRDEVAYLIGRHYYTLGLLDDAWYWFEFVSPASRHHAEARYHQGMTYIQQYEGPPAVAAFLDVVQHILRSGNREEHSIKLAEMAVLAIARTFYSTRQYSEAVQYYDQIPTSSRYWLDALFEKAWALFQLEEYNRSLGNLHSLNSPFFNDEFYPEGYYLHAVIYFRNCDFNGVRRMIEEFQYDYMPLLEQLEEVQQSVFSDEEFYELVASIRDEQQSDFSPVLQRLLNAAIHDRTVLNAVAYVEELDRELLVIRALQQREQTWARSGLVSEIIDGTEIGRNLGAARAGELVRIRLERASRELGDLLSRSEAILVETDLMEFAVVDARLREELNLADTGLLPPPVDAEHLMWNFTGEYWRDELGYYWYALRSRCGELGL